MKYVPEIIRHVKICGEKDTFCAHPVEAGEIFNFGNGEIAFMHLHTEQVDYNASLRHGQTGVHARAKVVLTRSFDGGYTWPKEEHVVLFDQGLPVEEQEVILSKQMTYADAKPLTSDTVFHFGKSFCGPYLDDGIRRKIQPFVMRSDDKGHSWSDKFALPEYYGYSLLQAHGPIVQQGNRLLKTFVVSNVPNVDNCSDAYSYCTLYSSEDFGVTWQYVSDIMRDLPAEKEISYIGLVDLGDGHLLATAGSWMVGYAEKTRWINVCHSYDNGLNWTPYRCIRPFAVSPYPLKLNDGRILVVYARRFPAHARGMFGIISDDNGETWSDEFAIRQGDTSGGDIGYPVATQMEDGTIFTAYYYMTEDENSCSKARHIAGTLFRI